MPTPLPRSRWGRRLQVYYWLSRERRQARRRRVQVLELGILLLENGDTFLLENGDTLMLLEAA